MTRTLPQIDADLSKFAGLKSAAEKNELLTAVVICEQRIDALLAERLDAQKEASR